MIAGINVFLHARSADFLLVHPENVSPRCKYEHIEPQTVPYLFVYQALRSP